jgi:hypothetical protein
MAIVIEQLQAIYGRQVVAVQREEQASQQHYGR